MPKTLPKCKLQQNIIQQYEMRLRSMDFTAFRLEIFAHLPTWKTWSQEKKTFVKSLGFQWLLVMWLLGRFDFWSEIQTWNVCAEKIRTIILLPSTKCKWLQNIISYLIWYHDNPKKSLYLNGFYPWFILQNDSLTLVFITKGGRDSLSKIFLKIHWHFGQTCN